ncbi:hypothetical protein TWF706_000175 [Orbilia oligospora]|nr:hypothetical protein TWF103_002966 [Orbilia oligospora]KAF3116963.1 hypothetical protein TWF706_000175 [Orbilia oligospora]
MQTSPPPLWLVRSLKDRISRIETSKTDDVGGPSNIACMTSMLDFEANVWSDANVQISESSGSSTSTSYFVFLLWKKDAGYHGIIVWSLLRGVFWCIWLHRCLTQIPGP